MAANSDDDTIETMKKIVNIKDQPFMMLNLMQITDTKSDKKYSTNVVPLVHHQERK